MSKNRQQVQPCFLLYPFYIDLYFNTEGEDEDGETKEEDKIPLKINPKEGDSKLNLTYYDLIVRAIEHWDGNIELILNNFAPSDDKIMSSRSNGKAKDDIKMKIIYIDTLFCRLLAR